MEILEQVEQLKSELDALRPLDGEAEGRIMQKFRLDWNYHSNKLEGNSYSYGETKMLLLRGLTAGGKPIEDYYEISGHDEAINYIIDVVKENEPLTEAFIRHLHKLILEKPSWIKAKTADGKPTKRLVKIGEYKTEPNHVETETGEIFYFAEPFETPAKMGELIAWFREKKDSLDANPILLAAEFHYRFIRIHPFDDGNGRMARLLMNFILMQYGYPPVIIKTEDKDNYIAALRQADFGILKPFLDYITQNVIRSLEIIVKGARGDDIEEPEDLDKELALLEREFRGVGRKIETAKSEPVMTALFKKSFLPIANAFIRLNIKFHRFYASRHFSASINESKIYEDQASTFLPSQINTFREDFKNASRTTLNYAFFALNQEGLEHYNYSNSIKFNFELAKFKLIVEDLNNKELFQIEKLYSEEITETDITQIVRKVTDRHMSVIKDRMGELRKMQVLNEYLILPDETS